MDANAAEHGIDCSRCTAIMYVDGVNMGHYYPYTFSEAAIGGEESASITWGSGSSGGQAHLRWNWVEFSILTPECKRPYFQADVVPADAMVYLNAGKSDAFGRRTCAAASLSLTQRASALANEESFDPSEAARPQVIPTPLHVLGRISPIFPPFFLVFCAFSPSRRHGSNEPQAGTQDQETVARAPKHRFAGLS